MANVLRRHLFKKGKKEELNNMKTRPGILHTPVLERTSVVSKGENGTKWRRQRTWVLQAKETVCLLLPSTVKIREYIYIFIYTYEYTYIYT